MKYYTYFIRLMSKRFKNISIFKTFKERPTLWVLLKKKLKLEMKTKHALDKLK